MDRGGLRWRLVLVSFWGIYGSFNFEIGDVILGDSVEGEKIRDRDCGISDFEEKV